MYRQQKEKHDADNRTAKGNDRHLPGLTDNVRPTEYWLTKEPPDNIRARAAETTVVVGSILLDVLNMYEPTEELRYNIEFSWVGATLRFWYNIRYRLRKLLLSLHHIPLPSNFRTEFETVEEVCRTLQRSLGDPGYGPGYFNFRTGRDAWLHACLLFVFFGVPDSDLQSWKEAALFLLLFISCSVGGNHPDVPDLCQELNPLLHITELGSPGILGYVINQRMLKVE